MKKRILILDDDAAVLEMLQILLDYEDFETAVIQKTDDLFALARLYQPSLILIDYSLNGKTGGDWCIQLKSEQEFAAIPVILFTAYSDKGIKKGAYGCDDFIAKPFDIDYFISKIKLLTDKTSTATLEANADHLPG